MRRLDPEIAQRRLESARRHRRDTALLCAVMAALFLLEFATLVVVITADADLWAIGMAVFATAYVGFYLWRNLRVVGRACTEHGQALQRLLDVKRAA